MKRTIAKSLILIVMMLPVISFAGTYSGGDGNEASPYQIGTTGDWQELMTTSADWDKHFILTADVNLAGITITPVGTSSSNSFSGVFDGNDYVLRNAVINQPDSNDIGIFGYVYDGGQIRNLGVEDVNITGYSDDFDVGGLVGRNGGGSIASCFWDIQTSGRTTNAGGLGKTTAEMMTLSTFISPPASWDFVNETANGTNDYWMMLREGEDYPRLAWQTIFPGDIAGLYGVDMADLAEVVDNWLKDGCPTNCEQADIDSSGYVDFEDFAILAENWLEKV